MAVIVYNPKTYNKKPSQPVSFLMEAKNWDLGVNKIARFPDLVGEEMLKTYGFLERVKPEDIKDVKKRMVSTQFECEHCGEEFETKKSLNGHLLGKHKISKETELMLDEVPEAEALPTHYVAKKAAPEASEGIPEKGKDKDGVDWYGKGLENDTDMKPAGGDF